MKSPSRKLLLVAAAVATAAIGIPVAWASHTFTDVPDSNPHHDDIDFIAELGVTAGCAPDLYCPDDFVRRDQMATFLANTIRLTEYGVAAVDVTRGANPPTTFAVYSTPLGSPIVDSTGGTFRFTCNADQAPCSVAVKAAALSGREGTVLFQPRVLIEQTGTPVTAPQPTTYCEYADGSDGPAGITTLAKQPKSLTPDYEALELDIGGSADCVTPPGPGGTFASIQVPEGFYNVETSFSFRAETP
jgi:hypothetical protein